MQSETPRAEDDPVFMRLLQETVGRCGFDCETCRWLQECTALWDNHLTTGHNYTRTTSIEELRNGAVWLKFQERIRVAPRLL